jgi:hypothetical protein
LPISESVNNFVVAEVVAWQCNHWKEQEPGGLQRLIFGVFEVLPSLQYPPSRWWSFPLLLRAF